MEVGVHTDHGQLVQLIAGEEHKPEQEPVLTHLQEMVEIIVLDLLEKVDLATHKTVLLMETGVHSHPGQAVQRIAEEEDKSEQDPAQILLLNMVEIIVLDLLQKFCLATPTIVLFMEVGVHSHHGQSAQLIAEEGHKPGQEPALIRLLNMVVEVVLGQLEQINLVTRTIAQVMTTLIRIDRGSIF